MKNTTQSICLLICGDLGFAVLQKLFQNYSISFILTNKGSQQIINFAEEKKIKYFLGNPRNERALSFIKQHNCTKPDVLISANYRYLIDDELIKLPKIFPINIHGSLLPKYRGRAPLIWAIINGEKYSGITVHIIDHECDKGDILFQQRVDIPSDVTGAEMVKLYESLYPTIIETVLNKIFTNQYNLISQQENEASYFGRRTPEDGLIDWNWDKTRIYNWIRALAPPYPGGFSFVGSDKVIIEKISLNNQCNINGRCGEVIGFEGNHPLIKVKDGVIKLEKYHLKESVTLKLGDLLK